MAFNYKWEEMGCHDTAQKWGAVWKYGNVCVMVWGKKVEITPVKDSIMEGFQITNFNFHTNGGQNSVSSPSMLPWVESPGKLGAAGPPPPTPTPYNPRV